MLFQLAYGENVALTRRLKRDIPLKFWRHFRSPNSASVKVEMSFACQMICVLQVGLQWANQPLKVNLQRTSHLCQPGREHSFKPKQHLLTWKTESDADITPPSLWFPPASEPGAQLRAEDNHTPRDLFKLFFSEDDVETLCHNSNKQAARSIA